MHLVSVQGRGGFLVHLLWGLLAATLGGHGQVLGPDPERVGWNSPEAWAMKYYASLTLPASFGVAAAGERGEVWLDLEVSEVPWLSVEERRVGFAGGKVEDVNHAELLIRPSVTVGLPWKCSGTLSYVPPLEVYGIESSLVSVSLQRPVWEWGRFRTGVKLFYSYGETEGPFTCSQELVEEGHDPFNCIPPSTDTNYQRSFGGEVQISYRIAAFHDLTPYATVSYQYLNTDFRTDAVVFGGAERDTRTIKSAGYSWAFSTGVTIPVKKHWEVSLGVFYSPLDVERTFGEPEEDSLVNVRTRLGYRF